MTHQTRTDASSKASGDASPRAAERVCGWCGKSLKGRRKDTEFCCRRCRQSAWRLRRRSHIEVTHGPTAAPGRFAYADPPYIGLAAKYYAGEDTFAGEVDHEQLIADLEAGGYIGWALSCSARSLWELLPMFPAELRAQTRICAWEKPHAVSPATYGLHNVWEALLVVRGRKRRPGVRDCLRALPARGGGTLPGRKPIAFCAWLFDCLGMIPGDDFVDLFPGTGIVGRAWAELSRRTSPTGRWLPAVADTSQRYRDDASARARDDASPRTERSHASSARSAACLSWQTPSGRNTAATAAGPKHSDVTIAPILDLSEDCEATNLQSTRS